MNKTKSKIAIMGCGWLGLSLGEFLTRHGYLVNGSTTNSDKLDSIGKKGIQPYLLKVTSDGLPLQSDFFSVSVLIIDFPPGRIDTIESVYPQQIKNTLDAAAIGSVENIIFTSSTSVYPSNNERVREDINYIPDKISGKALLKAEQIISNDKRFQSTILRLGGLIGDDRNPARSLARKKKFLSGNTPVNLIHKEDCIGIIYSVIEKQRWGLVLNACAPKHPLRSEFYLHAAKIQNIPLPLFNSEEGNYKIVDSSLLIKELSYTFKYADPMNMY